MNLAKVPPPQAHLRSDADRKARSALRASRRQASKIYAKRDDCNSGLAFGGNKVRKLEYLVPDALAQGCDTLVTIGGIQSNHTRQVAAVAAKLGMKCRLVQENWVDYHDAVYDRVGNILMSRVMGAHVELVDAGFGINFKESWEKALEDVRRRWRQTLRHSGRRVGPSARRARLCRLRRGGAGAGSGARLQVRLHLRLLGDRLDAGRHGGGLRRRRPRRARHRHRRLGEARGDASRRFCGSRERTADLVELGRPITRDDVVLDARYGGPAYGMPSAETNEAIRLAARLEGMMTDPVYEGKSMQGMIDMITRGEIPAGSRVLYAHLGGVPAINAYSFLYRNG